MPPCFLMFACCFTKSEYGLKKTPRKHPVLPLSCFSFFFFLFQIFSLLYTNPTFLCPPTTSLCNSISLTLESSLLLLHFEISTRPLSNYEITESVCLVSEQSSLFNASGTVSVILFGLKRREYFSSPLTLGGPESHGCLHVLNICT